MLSMKILLQDHYKWFIVGFIITPLFMFGCFIGNSNTVQTFLVNLGGEDKTISQDYADTILKAGQKSNIRQSLLSLKYKGNEAPQSLLLNANYSRNENQSLRPEINRLKKVSLLNHNGRINIPKDMLFSQSPRINKTKIYNKLDYLLYSVPGQSLSEDQFGKNSLTFKPKKPVKSNVPVPIRKKIFLARSKRYYGAKLSLKQRRKELRCLAVGVYFEARGEPTRGQIAVAQVIMNRVREGFYPNTICKVVFQGSHRKTGCQFSFTCDGLSDRPRNKWSWRKSMRVAKKVINGKVWLKDIGNASHYHATYVNPIWKKIYVPS